jgi:galactose mutarotase-like enzyme
LIGPHFHHRRKEIIPSVKDEALFPHIARVKSKGIEEPFSHGIGRYAPWKAEATPTSVKAELTGKDTWNGVPLAELEGQNFKMSFAADLQADGLHLHLSVVSDTDSIVGIHYYYHLPEGKGKIISSVQDTFLKEGKRCPIPSSWTYNPQHVLEFPLEEPADYTFYPYPHPCEGKIELVTPTHKLVTQYTCASQENAWQLYHPAGASFVCIEPVSAQDPRHPNLTVSSLRIHLNLQKD